MKFSVLAINDIQENFLIPTITCRNDKETKITPVLAIKKIKYHLERLPKLSYKNYFVNPEI